MNLTRKGKYILIAINFLLIVLLIGYNKLNPAFRKTVSHRIAMTEYAAPGSKVAKKIFFKENQNYHSAKFQISLKFFPELDVYDNVFQLGAEPTTFRVELSPPNTLSAVIGYQNANLVEIYKIKDNLSLNTWHALDIRATKEGEITIVLDEKITNVIDDRKVNYKINEIVVGAGYDFTRGFSGQIKDFSITYTLFGANWLLSVLNFISEYYAAILILQILGLGILLQLKDKLSFKHEDFEGLSKSFVLVIFLSLLPVLMVSNAAAIPNWIHVSIFFSLPIIFMSKNKYVSFSLSVIAILFYIFFYLKSQLSSGLFVLPLFFIVASVTLLENSKWIDRVILTILILFSWALISPLNTYIFLFRSATSNSKYIVVSFLASFALSWYFMFDKAKQTGSNSKLFYYLYGVGIAVLFFLSFRSDFIFVGSGESHWEYFIGVIRGLKNGSTLLWDLPSQYGLLNLYWAALLPVDAGQALYLLNGSLLFVVALLFVKSFVSPTRTLQTNIFIFLITISTLFFADPHLIDPYPYPTSTVVRFFWCYVILFFVFKKYQEGKLKLKSTFLILTLIWLLGFFWSAESAFYCSSIFGGFLIASGFFLFDYDWRRLAGRIVVAIGALLMVVVFLTIIYKLRIGYYPDWSMYSMYHLPYPSGFVEIPIDPLGVSWLLAVFFAVILWTCIQCKKNGQYQKLVVFLTLLVAFWATYSYCMSQAAPDNVTAILPLLCFISLISFNLWGDREPDHKYSLLKILILPIFLLSLLGGIGSPDFWTKLVPFRVFSKVGSISDKAGNLLQDLIEKAQIEPKDRIIFYGFPNGIPQWQYQGQFISSESTWGFDPMMMWEESIPSEMQSKIWFRHAALVRKEGYWIQVKGEKEDRAKIWLELISQTHKMDSMLENDKYKIIHFSLK